MQQCHNTKVYCDVISNTVVYSDMIVLPYRLTSIFTGDRIDSPPQQKKVPGTHEMSVQYLKSKCTVHTLNTIEPICDKQLDDTKTVITATYFTNKNT